MKRIATDYHLHTSYSNDGTHGMEEMIAGAIEAGMEEIVFTDHMDFINGEPWPEEFDCAGSAAEFRKLQQLYGDRIIMMLGIEIGLGPGFNHIADRAAQEAGYTFVIGSTHALEGADIGYEPHRYFPGKTKAEAYNIYLEAMLENVRSSRMSNVFGHLDYVERYGSYEDNLFYVGEHAELLDEILRSIVSLGKGLELNTSGFRYGLERPHPYADILRRYRELGGEIITVGSDAHRPWHVAFAFDRAREILIETGFTAYTLYRDGQPVWRDL